MSCPASGLLYDTDRSRQDEVWASAHLAGGGNGSSTGGMPMGGGLESGGGLATGVRMGLRTGVKMGLRMGVKMGLQHAQLGQHACMGSWAEAWQLHLHQQSAWSAACKADMSGLATCPAAADAGGRMSARLQRYRSTTQHARPAAEACCACCRAHLARTATWEGLISGAGGGRLQTHRGTQSASKCMQHGSLEPGCKHAMCCGISVTKQFTDARTCMREQWSSAWIVACMG